MCKHSMKCHISKIVVIILAFSAALQGCGKSGTRTAGDSVSGESSVTAGGDSVLADTAASIALSRTKGTVAVSDAGQKPLPVFENMQVYDGYGVGTEAQSYAWMKLDDARLAKLDESSSVRTSLDGKKLQLWLDEGSLFFNIDRPLQDDESLEIRSSSMVTGIRGTAGWVHVPDAEHMEVYILEGTVECRIEQDGKAADSASVSGGEMARLSCVQGETAINVETFQSADVPAFVREEIRDEEEINSRDVSDSLPAEQTDLMEKIAQLCREEDYGGVQDILRDGIGGIEQTVSKAGPQILMQEDGRGLGIYMVPFSSTSSDRTVMIYYGDYQNGIRQGNGTWIGVQSMLDFYATGQWNNDRPDGPQTVVEEYPDSQARIRTYTGTVAGGPWEGEIDVWYDYADGHRMNYKAAFAGGKYIPVEPEPIAEGNDLYFISYDVSVYSPDGTALNSEGSGETRRIDVVEGIYGFIN